MPTTQAFVIPAGRDHEEEFLLTDKNGQPLLLTGAVVRFVAQPAAAWRAAPENTLAKTSELGEIEILDQAVQANIGRCLVKFVPADSYGRDGLVFDYEIFAEDTAGKNVRGAYSTMTVSMGV